MPTTYFRSWAFDAGLALLAVGVSVTYQGIRAFCAADAAAKWHIINSPSSHDTLTFTARYTDPIPFGPWLIVGVLLVLAGLGAVAFAALRISRRR